MNPPIQMEEFGNTRDRDEAGASFQSGMIDSMRAVVDWFDVRADPVGKLPKLIGYATAMVEIVSMGLDGRFVGVTLLLTIAACVLVSVKIVPPKLVCTDFVLAICANEMFADPKAVTVIVMAYVWLFDMSVARPRSEALIYVLWVGGSLCAAHILGARLSIATLTVLVYALWAAVVASLGAAIQSQRLYVASVVDRAARAERTKEETALRRVAEERLRIARELHDVVAHHITVIGMQINLARARLGGTSADVESALVQAGDSTHSVILEMQDILQVLRDMGTDQSEALAPADVGSSDLGQLVQSFSLLENRPRLAVEGVPPPDIPPSVDLAVYRVVQEALTNAYKHGIGRAEVNVNFGTNAEITVTVRNCTAPRIEQTEASGLGLVGMRERVQAVGGSLDIVDDGRVFTLRAVFPPRRRHHSA